MESLPQVVKADVPKDEAETLKTALEAVGGKCEIDWFFLIINNKNICFDHFFFSDKVHINEKDSSYW